jgi:hypothetical protein
MEKMFWQPGFLNSIQMINCRKNRQFIIDNLVLADDKFLSPFVVNRNNAWLTRNFLKNVLDVFCSYGTNQRLLLIFHFIVRKFYSVVQKYFVIPPIPIRRWIWVYPLRCFKVLCPDIYVRVRNMYRQWR